MPVTELIRSFNTNDAAGATHLFPADDRVAAWYDGLHLESLFQPIIDIGRSTVVGHEAFLAVRLQDGRPVAVDQAFARVEEASQLVSLDRLCRTLHTLNFLVQQRHAGGYLYLNVHPRHLLAVPSQHGLIFEAVLKRCGLGPEDIVLELDEGHARDQQHFLAAVTAYRQRGYRVALDGVGLGAESRARLPALSPDIVKMSRELPALVENRTVAPAAVAALVADAHACGATVVAQGLESAVQLAIFRDLGADLAQGFFLGPPRRDCAITHSRGGVAYNLPSSPPGAMP